MLKAEVNSLIKYFDRGWQIHQCIWIKILLKKQELLFNRGLLKLNLSSNKNTTLLLRNSGLTLYMSTEEDKLGGD